MPVRSGWLGSGPFALCVAGLLLTSVIVVRAQAPQTTPRPAPRTTQSGIYTQAQADKGEGIYMGICVGCHPAITYTGPSFKQNWANRPLIDLFDWVYEKMPKNEPGTLTPQESVQVIAYILRLNKMPPGKTDLVPDRPVLQRIRIELK